jgi:hypothetical protein
VVTGVGCSVQLESSVEFGFGFEFYTGLVCLFSFLLIQEPRAELEEKKITY